jgi:hypothetical protein
MNDIIYSLIKAVLPLIVTYIIKVIIDYYLKLSDKKQENIKAVVRTAVLIAQQVYKDNSVKLETAEDYIIDKLGIKNRDQIKALIEETLAELKLQWGEQWDNLSKLSGTG